MQDLIKNFDEKIISFMRRWSMPMARFAIFILYFWFGLLKVIDLSPASPLVAALLERTLPFITFDQFIIFFGIFEMIIGIIFLIRGWERLAIFLLAVHLVTTIMPLFLVQAATWQSFLVPTLEGQYIIKNVLIIALAMVIASHVHPWKENKNV